MLVLVWRCDELLVLDRDAIKALLTRVAEDDRVLDFDQLIVRKGPRAMTAIRHTCSSTRSERPGARIGLRSVRMASSSSTAMRRSTWSSASWIEPWAEALRSMCQTAAAGSHRYVWLIGD